MRRVLDCTLWYLLGAGSAWQVYESLKRCGSIDGGAILIPVLIFFYVVGRDSARDLCAIVLVDKPTIRKGINHESL